MTDVTAYFEFAKVFISSLPPDVLNICLNLLFATIGAATAKFVISLF